MKISIINKFALMFIIIFMISLIFSTFYMKKIIENNNEEIVNSEMLNLMQSSREYIKQYYFVNNVELIPKAFEDNSQNIVENLSNQYRCIARMYTTKGELLATFNPINETFSVHDNIKNNDKDIELAKQDIASTTTLVSNSQMYVNFSYPLYIESNFLGIVRFTKNYSTLYIAGQNMTNTLTIFFIILFIIVFIGSLLISRRITKPILTLRESLKEVAKGNYNTTIEIKNNDEIGELTKDFCTMRDKIKKQIITIEDDKKKLIKAEKHRQEFFNNVTHELKTPLTNIFGYAQILEEEKFSDDKMYTKAVNRIKDDSERLHSMVVELLEVSKEKTSENIALEKIDIAPIIIKTCEDMTLKADKYNMKIGSEIEEPINIYGNAVKIQELFINILDNAIKYGQVNTSIEVKANKLNNTGYFEIKNIGVGIPQDKINKIFEPFYKINNTKKERGSCGLGLYICKDIVDKHNGEISVESLENQFTKIIIKIPLISNNLATSNENLETTN